MRQIIIIFGILLLLLTLISGFGGGVSTKPTYDESPSINYPNSYEFGTMLSNTREHYYDNPSPPVFSNGSSPSGSLGVVNTSVIEQNPPMATGQTAGTVPASSPSSTIPVQDVLHNGSHVMSESPPTFVSSTTIEPFEESDNTYAPVN